MKVLATLIARFSRNKSDASDAFETRLKSITSEKAGRKPVRRAQSVQPVLFRRGAHA